MEDNDLFSVSASFYIIKVWTSSPRQELPTPTSSIKLGKKYIGLTEHLMKYIEVCKYKDKNGT